VMCLMNYAEAIQEEGTFGEVAKDAWRKAAQSWAAYSNRDLPTRYNVFIRLADKESFDEKAKQALAELDALAPGIMEQILAEKLAALTPEERAAFEAPPANRTSDQSQLMFTVNPKMTIQPIEVANRVQGENRSKAIEAAERASSAEQISQSIDTERGIVNYDYWLLRSQIEPNDETLTARKLIYDGDQAFVAAQLLKASELYAEGMQKWREVLDAHPKLLDDASLIDELMESIDHYRSVLHQLDQKFPDPFVLHAVVDKNVLYRGSGVPVKGPAGAEASSEANDPTQPAP
jgi:hypothetical protein